MKKLLLGLALLGMNTTSKAINWGVWWGIPVIYENIATKCEKCNEISREESLFAGKFFYSHAVAKACEKQNGICVSRTYVRNQALTKTLPVMASIGAGSYAVYRYAPNIRNVVTGIGTTVTTKLKDIDMQAFKVESAKTLTEAWQESIKPELSKAFTTASSIATPVLSHPVTPAFLTAGFIVGSACIGNEITNDCIDGACKFSRKRLAGCTSLVGLGTAAGTAWTLKNLGHDLSSTPVALGAAATGAIVGGGMYHWLNTKEANARQVSPSRPYKGIGLFRELGVLARMPLGIWQHWNGNNTGN